MCNICECCHVPDYGACDDFCEGANGRCVYCDHAKECHPGKGELYNGPLRPGRRLTNQCKLVKDEKVSQDLPEATRKADTESNMR